MAGERLAAGRRRSGQAKFALNQTRIRSVTCCTQSKLWTEDNAQPTNSTTPIFHQTSPASLRQSDLSRACHRIDPSQSWLLESQCAHANQAAKFVETFHLELVNLRFTQEQAPFERQERSQKEDSGSLHPKRLVFCQGMIIASA